MVRSFPVALFTLILVSTSGCAGAPSARFDGHTFVRGNEQFHVAQLGQGWRRLSAPAGDLAWEHAPTHAVIAANATCRGHKDSPLEILLNDLLIGTTHRRRLLEEDVVLDGRQALHEVVAARLDGVSVVFDLYVLKKDGCVYDLALLVKPQAYDHVAGAFVDFVVSFRALGKGRG